MQHNLITFMRKEIHTTHTVHLTVRNIVLNKTKTKQQWLIDKGVYQTTCAIQHPIYYKCPLAS